MLFYAAVLEAGAAIAQTADASSAGKTVRNEGPRDGLYRGRNGEIYELRDGSLIIRLPGTGSGASPSSAEGNGAITIEKWKPGDFGIRLDEYLQPLPAPSGQDAER